MEPGLRHPLGCGRWQGTAQLGRVISRLQEVADHLHNTARLWTVHSRGAGLCVREILPFHILEREDADADVQSCKAPEASSCRHSRYSNQVWANLLTLEIACLAIDPQAIRRR